MELEQFKTDGNVYVETLSTFGIRPRPGSRQGETIEIRVASPQHYSNPFIAGFLCFWPASRELNLEA